MSDLDIRTRGDDRVPSPDWRARATAWMLSGGLGAATLSGCQSFGGNEQCDDCLPPKSVSYRYLGYFDTLDTKWTAHGCAQRDLKLMKQECGKTSPHFQAGFHQAYEDLALGRYAVTPPVPPSKYWTAYYRSCAGQDAVDEWFAGYRMGLEVGGQGGVSRFNRVATSWRGGLGDGDCANGQCDSPQIDQGAVLGERAPATTNDILPANYRPAASASTTYSSRGY
jgi:hypothetical protein